MMSWRVSLLQSPHEYVAVNFLVEIKGGPKQAVIIRTFLCPLFLCCGEVDETA